MKAPKAKVQGERPFVTRKAVEHAKAWLLCRSVELELCGLQRRR